MDPLRELSPGRVDQISETITGAERLAQDLLEDLQEASRENPWDGDLETSAAAVREAIRRLDEAQERILGVFLPDPGDVDVVEQNTPDIAVQNTPDRLLAEWTEQELLHAVDPAPEVWAEVRRRLADPEFRSYAEAEVRKAVPAVRAAMEQAP